MKGSFSDKSHKTVLKGLQDSRNVIRKVCARAIDKNTAELRSKLEKSIRVKLKKGDLYAFINYQIAKSELEVSFSNSEEMLDS